MKELLRQPSKQGKEFMKKTCSLLLLLFLTSSCVKTKIHGVRVESPASKLGYFKKVASCTPELLWKPTDDKNTSYDVAVYKALGNPDRDGAPPVRGEQVFYQEGITEPRVMITPSLESKTTYLWSVRMRRSNGEVTEWSTYDKTMNFGYYWSDAKGFWFGIRTPNCNQGEGVLNSIDTQENNIPSKSKVKFRYSKESDYDDAEIIKKLNSGEGGFILGAFSFGVKNKKADLSKYQSWEEIIQAETERRKPAYVPIYIIFPDGREIMLRPNRRTLSYLLMAPPGEYTLSRLTYGDAPYIKSARLLTKFNIEPGVLKYAGDILQIQFKSILGVYVSVKPIFRFNPEHFKKHIEGFYPLALPYLREAMLSPKELEMGEPQLGGAQ